MSQTPETTHHNNTNPLKPFFHSTLCSTEILSPFMKPLLLILLIASISLFSYTSFLNPSTPFQPNPTTFTHDVSEEQTNLTHVVFGLGGTTKTWNHRRHYSESWWKRNITSGFVWLDENPSDNNLTWPDTSPPYRVSSDTSKFKYTNWYGSQFAVRIARIVKESFELELENVRCFVMGDDDTVFFTENLVNVLGKYDYNEMYYVGGNSESVEQYVIHSYGMACGGGGLAVSYGLAVELVTVLDGCIDRYAEMYGSDQKIGGLYEQDWCACHQRAWFSSGDPYGLLAAHPAAPLVSLHHLDYVQPMFPGLTQIDSLNKLVQAYNLDLGRTPQHCFCYDLNRNWSISVSWSYTTFVTWKSWSQEPFTFNTRAMSPDPCERPVIYFLDWVEEAEQGQTRTTYKRFEGEPGKECGQKEYVPALFVQFVNVSAAKFDPGL
ncbi:hypothetical protein LOK49_LG10G02007 [Camellia lanceoleosa]|uniref:Uncharacterized protein n=1 Tax=Camellia lanceoleosa TaxID=1840588 RepID=A0ACC0GE49_9ERIC|nr:hypothetical protein LOK49_LG10G02007 [Camellia lanceoleosa]